MRRTILSLFLSFAIALIAFLLVNFFILRKMGRGALQVTSVPKSAVYLNGTLIGQTPFCKCDGNDMFASGEYSLKMIPDASESAEKNIFPPFEQKIVIGTSLLTGVDRTFGKGGAAEGSVLTLFPIANKQEAQVLVLSFPQKADVIFDSVKRGETPLLLSHVTASDHAIILKKEGYRSKTIHLRSVLGHKLETLIFLGIESNQEEKKASASAQSENKTATNASVLITQTPTGFLNVRSTPPVDGVLAPKIAEVYPGNAVLLIEEKDGWYKIELLDGKTGWISSDYAQKK
ncbi:MAG: hypothetical protein A3J69_00760 [Candidatus Levybacteria bacterium RIFCSPHIGHO2_02_FULL_42_12]|nr:MAG: hypothetical protein A3J69_00760 [Candidatus Levybacteria bacterium RIFCSPHIGHO2_02_FULL_42_12]